MKKMTSYGQLRSKALAVFMAALLASFSFTPVALADDVQGEESNASIEAGVNEEDGVSTPVEDNADEKGDETDAVDGKIHLTLALPSKSFVYDREEHSIFDEVADKEDDTDSDKQGVSGADASETKPEESDTVYGDTDNSMTKEDTKESDEGSADEVAVEGEEAESGNTNADDEEDPENTEVGKDEASAEDTQESTADQVDTDGVQGADETDGVDEAIVDETTEDGSHAGTDPEGDKGESTDDPTVEVEGVENDSQKYPVLTMLGPDEFTFTYQGEVYTIAGLTVDEVTSTEIGTVEYTATGTPQVFNAEGVDVSADFELEIIPGTLVIEQRTLILVSDSLMKPYEPGVPLVDESGKVSVEGDGFLEGDGAHYTFTGSQEEIGTSLNAFTYEFDEGTDARVYEVIEKPGTLHVTGLQFEEIVPITVDAVTETITYDGKPHYLADYATSTFSLEGEEGEYTVEAADEEAIEVTEVGEYTFEPTGPFVVTDAYGNDVSEWFDVTWQPVTLVIEPRVMCIKVNDQIKLYGEEDPYFTYQFLTEDPESGQAYAEQLADQDDLGEITLVREEGEEVGDYAIVATYTDNENYEVTVQEGTLTIEASKIEVLVESTYATYDGEAHSVTVDCELPDVLVLYKTPESDWDEENPAYTEIGEYPVYVQIVPAEDNHGNMASDVAEAKVVISSDDSTANKGDETEEGDDSQDPIFSETPSSTKEEEDEPEGPASPDEDPDFAEPTTSTEVPTNTVGVPDPTLPTDLSTVDVDVADLTIPDTADTDLPSVDLDIPENAVNEDTAPDSELLATTASDNAVGATDANKTQSSETVPMTVAETSSSPFGGIFGIVAIGIIVLAICGIGAAIYLWRTKEQE